MKSENAKELYYIADTSAGMLRSLPVLGMHCRNVTNFQIVMRYWSLCASAPVIWAIVRLHRKYQYSKNPWHRGMKGRRNPIHDGNHSWRAQWMWQLQTRKVVVWSVNKPLNWSNVRNSWNCRLCFKCLNYKYWPATCLLVNCSVCGKQHHSGMCAGDADIGKWIRWNRGRWDGHAGD